MTLLLVLTSLILISIAVWQLTKILELSKPVDYNNDEIASDKDNDFQGYQMAVIVDDSDFAFVQDNTANGPFSEGYVFPLSIGITNLGDAHARTKNNHMTDFATGYFASGNNGIFSGNTAEGGQTGFFFCTGGGSSLSSSRVKKWNSPTNPAASCFTGSSTCSFQTS